MNTGIQDGYNLAWKLACVLKAGSPSALLDSYNEERLPNARRLLQTTDRLFHLGSSEDAIISFIRTRIFPYVAGLALSFETVRSAIFPLVSQIGINYRESSLSVGVGEFNVAAGDRMPWFEVDGRSIYHDLHSPLFHLIVFTDGNVVIPPLPVDLTARWAGRIDSHVYQLDEKAARIFGSSRSFFLVLRPDNYIGMISNDFSPVSVAKYLERF